MTECTPKQLIVGFQRDPRSKAKPHVEGLTACGCPNPTLVF